MIECPRGDIRDLLPDLLHDRLSAATRAEVEHHVAECASCEAELELLGAMRDALSRPRVVDASRIAAAVRSGTTERQRPARAHMRRLDWRAAAAAAVLITGGLTLVVVQRAPVSSHIASPSSATTRHVGQSPATGPGLMFGGGFADLSDGDLEQLLQDVDSLSALPPVDPMPVLRGVEEGAS